MLKELRETLRDRRTIITLVVMPTLIYPLLALAFQRFLLTSVSVTQDVRYDVAVESELVGKILFAQLQQGGELVDRARLAEAKRGQELGTAGAEDSQSAGEVAIQPAEKKPELNIVLLPSGDMVRLVRDSTLHLAVIARHGLSADHAHGLETPMTWELVYRMGSVTSEAALNEVETRLDAFNAHALDAELKKLGVTAAMPAPTIRHPIRFSGAPIFSLAALIPLVLVLMTVTGAVYPAIDLTAGERERGTLEMLIAAPVPRLGLLLAKYAAVLTVALLTALVNLTAMTITVHSTGLATSLLGAGGMSAGVVIKVLLLLALFAAFFSAILLAITSYARSFKEAQAYIIPLMLLCLVPGVLCMMPSLMFTSWMSVTPLVNILMLARDLLEGSVQPGLAAAAVLSTAFYVAAAIALAARIFGTDAILYGSQATWSDVFRRPERTQRAASVSAAMLALAVMFPAYFVLANSLAHSQEIALNSRLTVAALVTAVVFAGIPLVIAMFGRVDWSSGLGLRLANPMVFVAAGLLGVSLWPLAHEVYLASVQFGISALGPDQIERARTLLNDLQGLPLPLILITLAIAPGVFEELCFRGFLFSSLRAKISAWQTIVVTAVLFGLFHEVLGPGRMLPAAGLGLVLGWVRQRTGSVFPCMLLHMLHNGLLLSIGYWREPLMARGWGVEEQAHLPTTWLAAAVVGIVLSAGMLVASTLTSVAEESAPSVA
jgi:ABC-2 type transport system permease protein/sodium transport system permease protein